jgi:DNA helicase-2/ATP-dependent DNA helicase PcrA
MEANEGTTGERISLMTLHAAKGLEFDTVFLPGWEEGLFPSPRAIDENGRSGLEEERRLAHVGLTRARRRARIYFASNRRLHGMWNATVPSRFINDLPEAHVEVMDAPVYYGTTHGTSRGGTFGGYQSGRSESRFDKMGSRSSDMNAQRGERFSNSGQGRGATVIEGRILSSSTRNSSHASSFQAGARVFHVKFGPGTVSEIEGQKLTVDFDKAGRKMVLESFVQAQ